MTSLAKKTKASTSSFLRRKQRVNATIKSHGFSHRLLVNRSNLYTYAQVIDAQ
jgi:ribosomal protein L18